ncbi:MAG: large protein [Mucilaginibacter sp.]|nr:large protein [Mucilaginibacter sp.]
MKKKVYYTMFIALLIALSACQKNITQAPGFKPSSLNVALNSTDNLSSSDAKKTIDKGLVGYYPFLGNPNDASGYGINGTLRDFYSGGIDLLGLPTLTTDKNGNANSAYRFNGLSDFIYMLKNPLLNGVPPDTTFVPVIKGISQFSMYVRFKTDTIGSLQTLIQSGDAHAGPNSLALSIYPDNSVSLGWAFVTAYLFTGHSAYVTSKPNVIKTNTWSDLVINFNDSKLDLFLNGNLVGSSKTSFSTGGLLDNFRIGTTSASFPIWFFNGTIDEVRVYSRPLVDKEIQYLLVHKKIQ